MDYKIQDITNYYLYGTEVDNLFLGEFMLDAPGDYVKVYLLSLMFARAGIQADSLKISKQLSLSAETVDKAWDYWADRNIVRKLEKDPYSGAYQVELLNLRELMFGHCASDTMDALKNPTPLNLDGARIAEFYANIEKITGRLLEAREPELLVSWVKDFGMPPELIEYCYRYSTERGKSNRPRYVEKILLDWREKGFKTVGEVEEYLGDNDRQTVVNKAIFKELGFRRNPTAEEKRIMRVWTDDMGYSLDEIKEACKKTAGIPNPSVNYVNAILVDWYNKAHSDASAIGESNTYNRIEELYSAIRRENSEKTEKIRTEIYTKIPRLRDIMEELKGCGFDVAKAVLSGRREAVKAARAKQQALLNEKKELLTENGYAQDALDSIYACGICKDTGVLDDGTTCSCYAEKLQVFN